MDFFKSRKKSSIVGFKRYWNDFCRRTGYINQENPPTEELYSEYFRKKKEAGETDKEMWNIYLNLRKLAFHAFNQKLRDYPTVKQYLVYADRERLPVIYDPHDTVDKSTKSGADYKIEIP